MPDDATIVPPPALPPPEPPPAPPTWAGSTVVPNPGGPPTPATAEAALAQSDPMLAKDAYANLVREGWDLYGRQQAVTAGQSREAQQRSAAMEPRIQEYERAVANRQLPPVPEPHVPPKPPTYEDAARQTWDQGYVSAAMFLGVLAGSLSRRPVTNALAAFTGMNNGIAEGNKEKFENNMKTWEAENKRAIEMNNAEQKRYENILKRDDLSEEQKRLAVQIEAMRWDNKGMQWAAQQKGIEQSGHLLDGIGRMTSEYEKATKTATDMVLQQQAQQRLATPQAEQTAQAMAIGALQWPSPNQRNMAQYYYQQGLIDRALEIQREKGITGGSNVTKREGALQTAEGRVLGQAGTNIEIAMSEAGPILERAATAKNLVPATNFPRINKIYNMAANEIGDPAVRNLQLSVKEVEALYAKVLNPRSNVITEGARKEAHDVITAIDSPAAFTKVLENIQYIVERERVILDRMKKGLPPEPINIPPPNPDRTSTVGGMAGKIGGGFVSGARSALGLPEEGPPRQLGRQPGPPSLDAILSKQPKFIQDWFRSRPPGTTVTPLPPSETPGQ